MKFLAYTGCRISEALQIVGERVDFDAGVKGPQATPKGLRHGFGVGAIHAGIPLNLLQRWLGHAQLTTTAICANAVGPEERNIAARMWQ